jgi:subtilase family serine protease
MAPALAELTTPFLVEWTTTNSGTTTTAASFFDGLYLSTDSIFDGSDILLGEFSVSALGVGESSPASMDVSIPSSVTPGAYHLLVVADHRGDIAESDELDNVDSQPILVTTPEVDLVGLDVAAESTTLNYFVTHEIDYQAGNVQFGEASAPGGWFEEFYLSADGVLDFDGNDFPVASAHEAGPVGPGSTYSNTADLVILPTSGIPAGNYFLVAVINADQDQAELDYTNNTVVSDELYTVPPYNADLDVTAANAPASAVEGETITFDFTVTNIGTDESYTTWYDSVFLSTDAIFDGSDTALYDLHDIAVLEPGESTFWSQPLTIPDLATSGVHYLLFVADRYGDHVESNEDNNLYALEILISAPEPDPPNLAVIDLDVLIDPVVAGDTFGITWRVENNGTEPANGDWLDAVILSTDSILDAGDLFLTHFDTGAQTPLEAGGFYDGNWDVVIPRSVDVGSYFLFVHTDYQNDQDETDDLDNWLAAPLDLVAPDLVMSPQSSPTQAFPDEEILVEWLVTNTGAGAANQDWSDSVYLSSDMTLDGSDTLLGSLSASAESPLAVSDSYPGSLSVTIPAADGTGPRFLIFVTDGPDSQEELDESVNNQAAVPIEIIAPNLEATALVVPSSATAGDTIPVGWTVENSGSTSASSDWWDHLYLSTDEILGNGDDVLLLARSASGDSPLAPGATYSPDENLSLSRDLVPGVYHVFLSVDHFGAQAEVVNSDNVLSTIITLTAPDLAVTPVTTPAAIIPGDAFSVEWEIANVGAGDAYQGWNTQAWLSLDSVIDGSDLLLGSTTSAGHSPLGPGSSYVDSISSSIPRATPHGAYKLIVVTDHTDSQEEIEESSNNSYILDVTVSAPDLAATALSAPASALAGEIISVDWTIENETGLPAVQSWHDRLYLSSDAVLDVGDSLLGEVLHDGLEAGDDYAAGLMTLLPEGLTPGTYHLYLVTDQGDAQEETDEAVNNVRSTSIEIEEESPTLTITGFDVQKGAVQRSYIRYFDLSFASDEGLADIVASVSDGDPENDRIKLTRKELDGTGGTPIPLASILSAVDDVLAADFGPNGITGNRNAIAGDGYYEIEVDLDGDGSFDATRRFYRLLGDTNGDGKVTDFDVTFVNTQLGMSGGPLDGDVNGDGVVNQIDRSLTRRSLGRKLTGGLSIDD